MAAYWLLGHVRLYCNLCCRYVFTEKPVWNATDAVYFEATRASLVTDALRVRMPAATVVVNNKSGLLELLRLALHAREIHLSAFSTETCKHMHEAAHQHRHLWHCRHRRPHVVLCALLLSNPQGTRYDALFNHPRGEDWGLDCNAECVVEDCRYSPSLRYLARTCRHLTRSVLTLEQSFWKRLICYIIHLFKHCVENWKHDTLGLILTKFCTVTHISLPDFRSY